MKTNAQTNVKINDKLKTKSEALQTSKNGKTYEFIAKFLQADLAFLYIS